MSPALIVCVLFRRCFSAWATTSTRRDWPIDHGPWPRCGHGSPIHHPTGRLSSFGRRGGFVSFRIVVCNRVGQQNEFRYPIPDLSKKRPKFYMPFLVAFVCYVPPTKHQQTVKGIKNLPDYVFFICSILFEVTCAC